MNLRNLKAGDNFAGSSQRPGIDSPITRSEGQARPDDMHSESQSVPSHVRRTLEQAIQASEPQDVVSVWIDRAGSGHLAYAIAMILDAAVQRMRRRSSYRVICTLREQRALDIAQAGIFERNCGQFPADLSPVYTRHVPAGTQISMGLMSNVIVRKHDFMTTKPFIMADMLALGAPFSSLKPEEADRLSATICNAVLPGGWVWHLEEAPLPSRLATRLTPIDRGLYRYLPSQVDFQSVTQ